MGTVTRWEAERAAAVMARSRAGTSARRRAEILARRARQAGREGTGVAGTAVHQEVTPPIWRRAMAHDDGAEAGARLFFLVIGGAVGLWVFWPGIVLGAALYGIFYGGVANSGREPRRLHFYRAISVMRLCCQTVSKTRLTITASGFVCP